MPLWSRAAAGNADWSSIYAGYNSATDWPTVSFVSELVAAFPDVKYILT